MRHQAAWSAAARLTFVLASTRPPQRVDDLLTGRVTGDNTSVGSRRSKRDEAGQDTAHKPIAKPPPRLPRKALSNIHLGRAFAEYDSTLRFPDIFVRTPALTAALDDDNPHCFFVGRRGAGKTAIARYVETHKQQTLPIRPELFSPSTTIGDIDLFSDMKQKPFRSLVAAFRRSLQDEAIIATINKNRSYTPGDLSLAVSREYSDYGTNDFDVRTVQFIAGLTRPLRAGDDAAWLSEVKTAKNLAKDASALLKRENWTVLVDAIDDFWDGSAQALLYLTALMHATLEINAHVEGLRVLVFLRENMFERIRVVDSEFSRLETCVVGLDWSERQLVEMIERRVNAPLNTKIELGGPTWDAFFENGKQARDAIFGLCQNKPRDVLTYTNLALDNAQSAGKNQVSIEDLQDARRRFSDSRLDDLSDEYQENLPQIGLVLRRFYGLGYRFSLGGFHDFYLKLMEDDEILTGCRTWIFALDTPEALTRQLYDIGFLGFHDRRRTGQTPLFRSAGPRDTTPPPLSENTDIVVHPTYRDALDLQDIYIDSLIDLNVRQGRLFDFPDALDLNGYREKISELLEDLNTTPQGRESARHFEGVVGQIIRYCLYRPLTNVQEQVRDHGGTVRRDWVASNRASMGFWETMRLRYDATQVVFECKNYDALDASDFHQAAYYMTGAGGRLVFLVFRGEFDVAKHGTAHLKRIATEKNGLVIPLSDRDLRVFLRQSLKGRVKDDHLQNRYDEIVRAIA